MNDETLNPTDWKAFRLSQRLSLSHDVIDTLYRKIAVIDSAKSTFSLTNHLMPQTLDRLTQSVIVTSTGASNRIEGNLLTDEQVQAIYKNMRIRSFKTRDEQEVAGYIDMLERVFDHHDALPLNENAILQLHNDMLQYSDKDQRHKGKYKFGSNRVEAKDQDGNVVSVLFEPTPPFLVAKEMQELLAWYHWACESQFRHPLILIANFIFEYLAIHPFQDGNGRTSRLLTNLLMLQHGYTFTKLVSHEKLIESQKAEYYLALNQTQRHWKTEQETLEPWLVFLIGIFEQQALSVQALLKQDQFEYLLSEKQLALWSWAKSKPTFSRKEAIEALGYPARTIEEIIRKLHEMKKLERLGEGRASRYRTLA
jgi:Fic family protein